MRPFEYPTQRHRRRHSPPPQKDHRGLKPLLRDEFARQCIYCRLPDTLKGQDSFSVEHYQPQSRFPHLAGVYENLFYACTACNRRKSDAWPSRAMVSEGLFFANPCAHTMSAHLKYREAEVEPLSGAGLWTEMVLMINDNRSAKYREFVRAHIVNMRRQKSSLHRASGDRPGFEAREIDGREKVSHRRENGSAG